MINAHSEGTWQEYWVSQIQIHHQMVTAWIAQAQGRRDEALQMLRAAADREDSTEKDPVTPGHVISARELLGDLLLEINEPALALQAYEAALKREPSRFWTLLGAAQAADRAGDSAKAKTYYTQLVAQTADADPERPGAERSQSVSRKAVMKSGNNYSRRWDRHGMRLRDSAMPSRSVICGGSVPPHSFGPLLLADFCILVPDWGSILLRFYRVRMQSSERATGARQTLATWSESLWSRRTIPNSRIPKRL